MLQCRYIDYFYFIYLYFIQLAKAIKMTTKQKHEVCWAAGEHKRALSPEELLNSTQLMIFNPISSFYEAAFYCNYCADSGNMMQCYTPRFLWPTTWVIYYAVLLWLLQVAAPLRVQWGYSDTTACVVASQPFVTVASGYPHITLNGTVTCRNHNGTA